MKRDPRIQLLNKNTLLIKPINVLINVKSKKTSFELGTTSYTFSYSFKGDYENMPINSQNLSLIAKTLAKTIKSKESLIIAMDRGGTALGVALSLKNKNPLHIAFSYFTKPPANWIAWEEPGAGKILAVPPLPKDSRVILIDDEIDTGLTYIKAVQSFREHSVQVDQIAVLFEVENKTLGRKIINGEFPSVKISSLFMIPQPQLNPISNEYFFSLKQ